MVKRVRERGRGKENHPSQNLSLGLERRELELEQKKHQANQAKERGKENQPSQAKERGKEKENQASQKVAALEKDLVKDLEKDLSQNPDLGSVCPPKRCSKSALLNLLSQRRALVQWRLVLSILRLDLGKEKDLEMRHHQGAKERGKEKEKGKAASQNQQELERRRIWK